MTEAAQATIENPEFMIYNFMWVGTIEEKILKQVQDDQAYFLSLGENNGLCKKSL